MRESGLSAADDETVWYHAQRDGFAIVTKDDDFRQRSFLQGFPPKVVWIRLGNCSTADVEKALRANVAEVTTFGADTQAALFVLSGEPPTGTEGVAE